MNQIWNACALVGIVVTLGSAAEAREEQWYDSEALRNDPIVALSRLNFGFEHTESDSPREKIVLGGTWALGAKTGGHDWAVGLELPVLLNYPKDAPDKTGVGDFKIRFAHTWLENDTWLVGSFFETEFDTAASNVETIANQRNQMCFGTGFIRNLGNGWATGGAAQYGWSLDSNPSGGSKSEWEARVGLRKKLADNLSLTVVYKGTVNVANDNRYSSSIEPSLAWNVRTGSPFNVYLAWETPLQDNGNDFTGKLGFAWVF